jgi:hypothetical protein
MTLNFHLCFALSDCNYPDQADTLTTMTNPKPDRPINDRAVSPKTSALGRKIFKGYKTLS